MTPESNSRFGLKRALGVGLVALAFCYVAVVTLHLYKQFTPNYDSMMDTAHAEALLHRGIIPLHGGVSSFYAFNPPGIAWGLVPGLMVFPREAPLAERVSALLLLAVSLAGLYLLLASRLGDGIAVVGCLIFALSERGFFFADSLSPRAHPVFLIWLVYFVDRWVTLRRPSAFVCAVAIALASDNWFLEGVTAIVIIPLVWIAFRPPVRWRDLALAAGIGALIWMPYLAFEVPRNFADLRSLFSRKTTITDFDEAFRNALSNRDLKTVDGYRPHKITGGKQADSQIPGKDSNPGYRWLFAYASPGRPEWVYQAVEETEQNGVRGRWTHADSLGGWTFVPSSVSTPRVEGVSGLPLWLGSIWKLVVVSMPGTKIPGGAGILASLLVVSVLWGFNVPIGQAWRNWIKDRPGWLNALPKWGTAAILIVGTLLAFRGRAALSLNLPEQQSLAAFSSLCLGALLISLVRGKGRWALGVTGQKFPEPLKFTLAAAALCPWFLTILLMADDSGVNPGRRFLWLWVVQGPLIVLFLWNLPWGRFMRICALSFLLLLVAINDNSVTKTSSWYRNGFHAAPPNDFNEVVDFLGRQIRAEGRTSAFIGYDVPFGKWIVEGRQVDGASKVGIDYDTLLRRRYGITDLDTTAEGISPDDEFRIVEHSSVDAGRQTYFDLSGYPGMSVIYQSATYTVLRK